MIPIPAWLTLRLVGVVAGVAAVALMGWRVNTWHTSHGLLRAAEKRLEAEEGCEPGSMCSARVAAAEVAQAARNLEAVTQYEQEIARLNARPVRTDPVRLCVPARRSAVRVPKPTAGTGRDSAAGVLDRPDGGDHQPGPDIGPALRQYAIDAEKLSASKRAIVKRDEALVAD